MTIITFTYEFFYCILLRRALYCVVRGPVALTTDTPQKQGSFETMTNLLERLRLTGVALLAAGVLAVPAAYAQDETDEDAAEEEDRFIVTAQFREEAIEDVPISISAYDDEDLEARGFSTLEDLQYSMPNVSFSNEFQTVSPRISIRGINSNTRNVGFESGLGVYLDGVYTGRSQSNTFELPDIEQIEVLRGPQGVLFGKNTTAGAVLIHTVQPDEDFRAEATVEAGNFDLFRANGYIVGPLADNLFFKVAGFYTVRDGTVNNIFTGTDLNDLDSMGGRVALRLTPTPELDITLSADIVQDRRARSFPEPIGNPAPFPPSTVTPGPRTVNLDLDGQESRDMYGFNATVDYNFANDYQLTSITGWRRTHMFDQYIDNDDTPGPTVPVAGWLAAYVGVDGWDEDISHFSQELRLTSPNLGGFDYIVGAYYFDQTAEQDQPVFFAGPGGPALPLPAASFPMRKTATVDTTSVAVFGYTNFYLNEFWTLSGGLRFTHEEKDLSNWQLISTGIPFAPFAPFGDSLSDENFSPSVSLLFEPTNDINLYARIAQGYKSGGFNADFVTFDPSTVPASQYTFEPETVTNYEVGGSFVLFDGASHLDVSVFYMDYENLQVQQFSSISAGIIVDNAAEATIQGFEVEFDADLNDFFTVYANVGYLDATFDSYRNATPGGADYTGNRLQDAPDWTFSIAGEFNYPVANVGEFFAFAEYAYRGDRFNAVSNAPVSLTDPVDTVNGRIGLSVLDGQWEVALWGRNLLDDDQEVFNIAQPFWGYSTATYNDPRMFGVSLSYSYGE